VASMDPFAITSDLAGRFSKLTLTQKVLFPLMIAASIAGIIFVSKWASTADYAVLYSDLEPADASAVIERLKDQKIKYEVQGDGRTIAITPATAIHELRLGLAAEGLPKAGKVGFEIMDGTSFGMTLFQEKTLYQRASQGELERTIASLDSVSSVRVHITQPEKSVFAKKDVKPTASVMLKLRPGASLDKKQVKGITHLVAGSVEGLLPENVSIVDIFGNLLSAREDEESLGIEATRLQYQRELEQAYIQRVEQMLSKILGPGRVVARVTAELDFSQSDREEESFDPGGRVIRSERSIAEGAGSGQRGGVPGVVSNLTNDPNLLTPPNAAQETSNRREEIKNYEVSRAVIKSTSPRGRLTRLSAAVLVDGTYEVDAAESLQATRRRGARKNRIPREERDRIRRITW
jgi:flagellar M-ring protein FliF